MRIFTHNGVSKEIVANKGATEYETIGYGNQCVYGLRPKTDSYVRALQVYYYKDFALDVSSYEGGWAFVRSYNPTHTQTITETISVGISSTTESNSGHSWGASVTAAYNGLAVSGEVNANYEGYISTGSI